MKEWGGFDKVLHAYPKFPHEMAHYQLEKIFEYSCAVKPHVRSAGNRQSGTWEPLMRVLLA